MWNASPVASDPEAREPVTPLLTRDANPLAAALAQRLATGLGLRMLVIKGPSLEAHGLRTGHASADIDLLLDSRASAGVLIDALVALGWRIRPVPFGAGMMTTHSETLVRDGWPNDLDVHWEFPGLGEAAFEVLWNTRVAVTLAGSRCWIPDRPSAIVLWALHSLRGPELQERHRTELAQLLDDVLPALGPVERAVLRVRLLDLGAGPVLVRVPRFDALLDHVVVEAAPSEGWQRKMALAHELTPWFQVLRDTPPRQRPAVLWQAVWPTSHDLRLLIPDLDDTPAGRVRARLSRMAKIARRAAARLQRGA